MAPRDPARGASSDAPQNPAERDPARGERIRELREKRGRDQRRKVSQKEVAQAVGVHPRAYQQWEYGGEIAWPNAVRLAVYHNTSADFILDGIRGQNGEDPIETMERRLAKLESITAAVAGLPEILRGLVDRLNALEPAVIQNRALLIEYHGAVQSYSESILEKISESTRAEEAERESLVQALHALQTEVSGLWQPEASAPRLRGSDATENRRRPESS